jgi:signal transduction histidine kinase
MIEYILGHPPSTILSIPSLTTASQVVATGTQAGNQFGEYFGWVTAIACLGVAAVAWMPRRRAKAGAVLAVAGIAPLQMELDKALLTIHDFAASQERFVGTLAQEIKAPLATALVHADQLLADGNEPATVQRYAKSIAEEMRHLCDLVDSFLKLVRPLAADEVVQHVPVHFHDLVLEAVRRCQSLAGMRAVNVVPMLADSSVEVLGDAILLEAMIENLVRNAVLSAPRGTSVDLRVRTQGDEVVLSVRDRGISIGGDRIDSVFDGFFQVPAASRTSGGTGLSLAIAKRVAEQHRGTISIRNAPDGGCEFEIQLPRWRP